MRTETKPKFSVVHTSSRPHQWRQIYDAWLAAADDPSRIQYVLICDKRWGFTELPVLRPQDKAIWATGRKCYVDGVNLGAAASTGDVLIVNADDQWPCEKWDTELQNLPEFVTGWCHPLDNEPNYRPGIDVEFLIHAATGTTDEFTRGICVMPIISRARYERLGYVFYPRYESMYADNDLHDHVHQDGCFINAEHLLFPHRHPLMNCADMDEQYAAQNRPEAYSLGREVWAARRANGFKDLGPGWKPTAERPFRGAFDQPLSPAAMVAQNNPVGRKPRLAVCLPGERFSSKWVSTWTIRLYPELLRRFEVVPIFGFSSLVYATRQSIWEQAVSVRPDYVLWIDDDNLVEWRHVEQLFRDLQDVPEADAATGWAWTIDVDGLKVSAGSLNNIKTWAKIDYNEMMAGESPLWKVELSGFPCFLMRGSIVEKLPAQPFIPYLLPSHPMGFGGEDYSFCRRLTEAGGYILLDRRVEVKHLKEGEIGLTTGIQAGKKHAAGNGQMVNAVVTAPPWGVPWTPPKTTSYPPPSLTTDQPLARSFDMEGCSTIGTIIVGSTSEDSSLPMVPPREPVAV